MKSRLASRCLACIFAFSVASFGSVGLTSAEEHSEERMRHYDLRPKANANALQGSVAEREAEFATRSARAGELNLRVDRATGVTRSVRNATGYLTEAKAGEPLQIAYDYVGDHLGLLGLTAGDLVDAEVTDEVFSAVTGATHIYLRQRHAGLPVYNGQLSVHVNRDGRILGVNNAFMSHLASSVNSVQPSLSAADAVSAAAEHLGIDAQSIQAGTPGTGALKTTRLESDLSLDPIDATLAWLPIRAGVARLVWNFQIRTPDSQHWYDLTVDAADGTIWTRIDWVASADYRVAPSPYESPDVLPTPPPADGRTVETDPHELTASPFGWHDTDGTAGAEFTIHRGNNVHAYEDTDGNNAPPASQPDCGVTLDCDFDFPIDFSTQEPSTYQDAAIANLFYWNNIIHDVQYHYGFDEAAGNFQENNYGNGGSGSDYVQAEAQDPGNCNANFATPPDGTNPRMQMFTCTNVSPARDGDFDALVIVHEYGHGISNRLVGGPSNVSCLGNTQQAGEGLSDWWGLMHTMEVGDLGTDARGVGTYLFGQPPTGPGIRDLPYSTDPGINNWTYEDINGAAVPHGVGSRFAQAAWEVTWALVDEHGFSADFYDAMGGAGNQRAMLYMNEGLKNTACSPAFTDIRDGMIQAATDNYGGDDVCLLWETFAGFGLGTDAISGGSGSTSPTNGFSIPDVCLCEPGQTIPVADAGEDQLVCPGASVQIGTPAEPGHTYLWSPGGQTTAQITVSPTETTEYTVTAFTDCSATPEDTVTVFVDPGVSGLSEDFEGAIDDWTADGLWHLTDDSACAAPEPGYSSPTHAFYYGQDGSCTYDTGAANAGELCSPLIYGIDGTSTLTFEYLRVIESFAGGSYDTTTVDVVQGGDRTEVFFLDSTTPSTQQWTTSGAIDISAFAGPIPIQVCFEFSTGDAQANDFIGWFIDDVVVTAGDSACAGDQPIFTDGFESGDTSAWSTTIP